MSWTPLAGVPNPIIVDSAGTAGSGYVLKCYLPGTTTSTSLAIDSSGSSPQTTITANADGIWEVSSNEIVPHIDRKSKWAIFENATNATANTPAYMGFFDNINQISSLSSVSVATITALKAVTGQVDNESITVLGHTTEGDGGGGIFWFDSSSSVTDDNGIYIQPDAGSGRWLRSFTGDLEFRWYGATGDGTTDDITESQATVDAAFTLRTGVYAGYGKYYFSAALELRADTTGDSRYGTTIRGDGVGSELLGASGITMIKGLAAGPTSGSMFDFCGLRDMQIRSLSSSTKAAIGFDISEMTRVVCDRVLFRQLDYGVRQTVAESPASQCWSNTFRRCTFQECDEWGIAVENTYDITVDACIFEASAANGGGISFTDDTTLGNVEYRSFVINDCTLQNLYKAGIEGGQGLNLLITNNYFENCAQGGTGNSWSYDVDLTKGNRDTSGFIDNLSIEGNTFNTFSTNVADGSFYNVGVEKIINSTAWAKNYTNNSRRVEVTNSAGTDSIRIDANLTSAEVSTGSAVVYGIDDGFQYANASHVQKSSIGKALRQIQKSDSRELSLGFASARPSTSDHRVGSLYHNDALSDHHLPYAWVCTAEGSPDTWKAMFVSARGTTTERDALSLGTADEGAIFSNESTTTTQRWTGSVWQNI